ncbi:MAG: tetratricopeptide repeat protein [Verrucomicrobia bacterium]|nr:tetratricopeptide repeat protein [Verrucomicrobiota bacterium]
MSASTPTPNSPIVGMPEDLHDPVQKLKRIGIPLVAGAGLALLVVLGLLYARSRADASRHDALMLMSSAQSFDELERVVSDFGKTPAAPLALLKIAHAYFNAGDYTLASKKYATFTATYATHAFAPVAELGTVHCVEAQGQFDAALRGFEDFAAKLPTHFLFAQATLGQARCLEQLGRLTQARIVYEQFLASHPQSPWTPHVEQLLRTVNQGIKDGRDGVARVQAPAPAKVQDSFFAPLNLAGGSVEAIPEPASAPQD